MLVFDGDCGFCTASARWIERRLPAATQVEPWQALDLDDLGLTESDTTTAAYWIDAEGRAHRGHHAVGRALIVSGGFWSVVGRAIVTAPISWIAGPVYALVARNRHRLPGSTDTCRIPD